MTSVELDHLVRAGRLKLEPADQTEFDGLVKLGQIHLGDARNLSLAPESRFDLAYGASHAFALAALRWHGYRSDSRYAVFQSVPHTLGLPRETWRILDKCHGIRNLAAYEGRLQVDGRLLDALIAASEALLTATLKLGPVPDQDRRPSD
jgi:hypothetical protein